MRRFHLTPLRLAAALVAGSFAFAGVAYAASLGLSSSKLHVWSQTLTKGTCTPTTTDDTYVQQNMPTSTAGATSQTLIVSSGGPPGVDYAFIRFDLSSCSLPTTAGADSATLTLNIGMMGASTDTISLFPVTSSWSSSTLNWNGVSGLTIGSTATASFTGSMGSHAITVTSDVDAAIKAGALWGWELRDTTSGPGAQTQIQSSEAMMAMNRPSLSVSYEK
jgi:hypothetical protein